MIYAASQRTTAIAFAIVCLRSQHSHPAPSLAPFDDQGYLSPLIVLSANRMSLAPVAAPVCKK